MKHFLTAIIVILITVPSTAQSKKSSCYRIERLPDEKVFERMEIYPSYKEGIDKLNQFLLKNIDIDSVVSSLNEQTRFESDTLKIQLIINKERQMSNLEITSCNNTVLEKAVRVALINSSCGWLPGESSGKYLTGWFKNHLVFTLDRRGTFLSVKIEWLDNFYSYK